MADLSVIINHHREPELLKSCLLSLEKNLGIPAEVFVADSAAMPDTAKMLKESFPRARYIPFERNVGFAHSVNAGIKASSAPFLFIINADIIMRPGVAVILLDYMRSHPRVALAGPKLVSPDGQFQPSAFRFYTPQVIAARRTFFGKTKSGRKALAQFMLEDFSPAQRKDPFPVDWLMGSALFARRAAVEEIGLLDARFFMYFEDVDWARRFWGKGWEVHWVPEAVLTHSHKRASRGGVFELFFNRYTRIHLASAIKYFTKHGLKTPRYGA